ncbi:MAG: DUF421 domain-containing protein [Kofleriaceae bacterium]|nr:DUF421 domain-containing protein [Kofleriaceae bacterium]
MNVIERLFGVGEHLDAFQMGARAFVAFFLVIALCRMTGMRAFGRKSSFDSVIVITLGAVLSRAVVGASPVVPTVTACFVLCMLHRLVAMATARSRLIEKIVKGESSVVYRDGIYNVDAMNRAGISQPDIDEAVRRHAMDTSMKNVREVRLEASGELSIILDRVAMQSRNEHQPASANRAG